MSDYEGITDWQMDEYETIAHYKARAEAAEETVRGHELMKWPDEAHRLQQQRNAAIRRAEAAEAIIDDIRRIVTEWERVGGLDE